MPWLDANCTACVSVMTSVCSCPGTDCAIYDAACAFAGFVPACNSEDGFIEPTLPRLDCKLEYWVTPLPSDARPSVNACLFTGVFDAPPFANACISDCESECWVLPTCDSVPADGVTVNRP